MNNLGLIILSTVALLGANSNGPKAELQPPEEELQGLQTELGILRERVAATGKLRQNLSFTPPTAAAAQALSQAQGMLAKAEYEAASLTIQDYLRYTQVPETPNYLAAQLILAQAAIAMGKDALARDAYLRYLTAAMAAPQAAAPEQLVSTIRALLPLLRGPEVGSTKRLGEVLAALSSLDLPPSQQRQVLFAAAEVAEEAALWPLAKRWFYSLSQSDDQAMASQAKLRLGIVAQAQQDWPAAEEHFRAVLTSPGGVADDLRPSAILGLARLAMQQRNPQTALTLYAQVPETAPDFPAAIAEQVYAQLGLRQFAAAKKLARRYLKDFPTDDDARALRELLPYLELQAGDLKASDDEVLAADQRLEQIYRWLSLNYLQRQRLSAEDTVTILNKTADELPTPALLKNAVSLFRQMQGQEQRLGRLRADLRTTIFTIGRAPLEALRPQWVQDFRALAELATELLRLGDRLAATEFKLYERQLSPKARAAASALNTRREKLLGPVAEFRRSRGDWQSFLKINELSQQVRRRYEELKEQQAQLAMLQYHSRNAPDSMAADIQARGARSEKALLRALELLRARQVDQLLDYHADSGLTAFVRDYASAIDAAADLVAPLRNESVGSSARFLATEGLAAWKLWRFVATNLYQQLRGLEKEGQEALTTTLMALDAQVSRYDSLAMQLANRRSTLELTLGRALPEIITHYRNATALRQSQHRKWQADLSWAEYDRLSLKRDERRGVYEHDVQELEEKLKALGEGVATPWSDTP